jgi:hypothetical protein
MRAEGAGDQEFCGRRDHHLRPFYYLPVAGNAYSMVRGCRKRLSDCQARWNGSGTFSNVANFGGFPWIPTGSTYAQVRTGRLMTADDILAAARQCLGTPFRHQGRLIGFRSGLRRGGDPRRAPDRRRASRRVGLRPHAGKRAVGALAR